MNTTLFARHHWTERRQEPAGRQEPARRDDGPAFAMDGLDDDRGNRHRARNQAAVPAGTGLAIITR